jgi:CO/xanthine dehydrogenase Mo-binding subunit
MAHAILVRSPHAHARIVSIDKRDALAAPGVLAVLTGTDYLAAGLGPIPHNSELSAPPDVQARLRRGAPIATRHYPLPADRARFVGEPVVLVVAETIAAAKDAAELVEITWEPLPTMVRAADEVAPNAPALWDEAPDSVCIDIEVGDASATAETFARAAHVVRLDTCAHSDTGVPMEPRKNHAEYDPATGRYTLYTGSSCDAPKARLDQPASPRWKTFLVTWIAVYPILLLISYMLGVVAPDLPRPAELAVGSLLLTSSLTWLVMPRLTTLLRPWLLRGVRRVDEHPRR